MQFLDSLLFLIILLVIIWSIKADLFFVIFGFAIVIFILFQFFFMDPFNILISISNFILFNPFGLFLLFIPLIVSIFKYIFEKLFHKIRSG